jgi:hypothetical protein
MNQTEVTLTGVEMPARDALHWALSQAKVRTYWLMYYEPDSKVYFLNIQPATRPRYDASGKRRNEIIREP